MKTKRNYSWTDPKTQMAIIADRSAGLSCTAIAAKYSVDKATVSRICSRFRQQVPEAEMAVDIEKWKEQLKAAAIAAIYDALKCGVDPYRRGGIGVQVLKGVGEFAQENAIQVNHFDISNIPEDWRSRYVTSTPEDERMAFEDEQKQDPSCAKLIGPAPEHND